MRTTLTIDDDILVAARGLAARQRKSIGEVISDLSRRGLQPPAPRNDNPTRNGVPLLPHRAGVPPVTLELVNLLRDDA